MKRLWQLAKTYWLFAGAMAASAAALGLFAGGQRAAAYWILGAVSIGEVLPLAREMVQDLRSGRYGVDILAATAIVTSVVMRQYWAGIVIVLMLTGGKALEDYAERRAKRELDVLLTHAPQTAHLKRGNQVLDVRASDIKVSAKIVIRPGEVVPVDARIVEGQASFDESSLTGESLPQAKKPGSQLLSGSVNLDGAILAEALHTAKDSQYEQIIKLVKAAAASQAPFVRMADRYAIPFTLVSFGIAFAAWGLSHQALRFLEVLVVATPCPLILAAPIAIISGMSRAAKHGIIIKTGSALERLAQARTFAFDKTGTLTIGQPTLDAVKTFNGFTNAEVLSLAASLERNSNHVLARAIVQHAERGGKKIAKAKHVRELAGSGLRAQVGGQEILVGRTGMLETYHVDFPQGFKAAGLQQTAAFVAVGGKLAGVITFKDEARPEAKQTLAQLKLFGVQKFLMITGDNAAAARAIARKLGIGNVTAEALPGDKILAVEAAAERPVAFVGDGVNDAPVLTASDVGIALGARGSTAASESADVVVMLDDLSYVACARQLANETFAIARQSILAGIGLSVLLMLIFASGFFLPIYGAAIQEVVDVIVIFNALRAHGSWQSIKRGHKLTHASTAAPPQSA